MTEQGGQESEQVTAELFQGFLDESDEMLAEIERGTRALEAGPDDLSHIHGIFRAVHSLKGNSSFFDFTNVKTFCHTLENFLDMVRDRRIEMSPETARFILEGADHLKAIFNRLHAAHGADVPLTEEEESFLRHVDERVGPQDTEEKLEVLRKSLLKFFGQHTQNGEMVEGAPLREVFDLISRNAPFLVEDRRAGAGAAEERWLLGPVEVTPEYRKLRSILAEARAGKSQETAGAEVLKAIEGLAAKHAQVGQAEAVEALDALKEDFEIFFQDAVGVDEMLADVIEQGLAPYAALLTEEKAEERAEERRQPAAAAQAGPEGGERRANFVRVDEALLDVFIDHVGELITLSELFNYLQRKLEEKDTRDLALNFKNTNQSFRELSHQLQKSLYEIRKAPLEGALAKLPRAVRA
ncbi:MAG: Hpt domain-containing protein, partial [Nitrospinae bacterium]|nr:Hpt domain-containing protein [Nitrospinota bacterium]